jgi:hypothetical protein
VVVALAGLVLAALVGVDCLNLSQSEAWTDLTRAPHLAAVSRSASAGAHTLTTRTAPNPIATVVAAVGGRIVGSRISRMRLRTVPVRSAVTRLRRPSRAPPALRFEGARS